MATARQFIQGALESLQVYEPGETVLPADLARGFTVINQMMDSWSNESMTCHAIVEQSGSLIAGKSAYTIGPGADFDMARPIRLRAEPGAAYLKDSGNNRYLVDVVEQMQWNRGIGNLENTNSNLPSVLFYDPQMPRGILNFFPTPNMSGVTAFWDSDLPLGSFPSLSTQLQLPPGYERAIETNLALALVPYFPSAVVTAELRQAARDSKGNVKRSNSREVIAVMDAALRRGGGAYNPYTDSTNRR